MEAEKIRVGGNNRYHFSFSNLNSDFKIKCLTAGSDVVCYRDKSDMRHLVPGTEYVFRFTDLKGTIEYLKIENHSRIWADVELTM